MNVGALLCGSLVMVITGALVENQSYVSVGVGLMWIALSVISGNEK